MSTLADVTIYDIYSNLPSAGIPGRLFFVSTGANAGNAYYDTGSAWVAVATGGGGGGGGDLTLLESHTASNSAALQFTGSLSSSYDDYLIELVGLVPATNNVTLQAQVSANGGVSWDSSTIYDFGFTYVYSGGTGNTFNGSDAFFSMIGNIGTGQPAGVDGELRLKLTPSLWTTMRGEMTAYNSSASANVLVGQIYAAYRSTTNPNAIQFYLSSGNIASGSIRIYGFSK